MMRPCKASSMMRHTCTLPQTCNTSCPSITHGGLGRCREASEAALLARRDRKTIQRACMRTWAAPTAHVLQGCTQALFKCTSGGMNKERALNGGHGASAAVGEAQRHLPCAPPASRCPSWCPAPRHPARPAGTHAHPPAASCSASAHACIHARTQAGSSRQHT